MLLLRREGKWPSYTFSIHHFHRDKTTMSVLQGMLPRDLLHYCQEHGLLESILMPDAPDADSYTQQQSAPLQQQP